MVSYLNSKRGFINLIGLLLGLSLLLLAFYYLVNTFFGTHRNTNSVANNVQPSTSIVEKAKEDIQKLTSKTYQQLQEVESLK
ncbi:MAG: hypothetical protein N2606_05135 [Candidatus Omnitrophica bacterium]|nr:hypothetical protein [Candidatus Omnitrophota bacterium]